MRLPDDPVERGFLFDAHSCTGCSACELACSTENALGWDTSWRQVITVNPERHPGAPSFHLSLACNHCEAAPCMTQCPTLAIQRDPGTGAVLIDDGVCIGCRYCSWVCPYDAPRFDATQGVMTKCTGCQHRLADGLDPACVVACPTSALRFGALEGERVVPGFPDTPARPAIRFTPVVTGTPAVASSWSPDADVFEKFGGGRTFEEETMGFRAEIPLWLFTTGVAALVGWVFAAVFGAAALSPVRFVVASGFVMTVSTLHLGRKERGWRALRNLRGSRLSREVAAVGAFVAVGVATAILPEASVWLGILAAALGLAALFAIDRVYDPVRAPEARPLHSADTLLTGPLVAAALIGAPVTLTAVAGLKGALYLRRWVGSGGGSAAALLGGFRIVALLVPVAVAWLPFLRPEVSPRSTGVLAAVLLVGELVDRAQFYAELRVVSPRSQAVADAEAWVR